MPPAWTPHINRGYILDALGQYDLAIKDFTQAIVISPECALAYCDRGISYTKKRDFEQACATSTGPF